MDPLNHQVMKTSSGRESQGMHLCHKCGWPFPNAHPSAKQRRAHKKVCGTTEGYELFESDDHLTASEGTSDNPIAPIQSIKTSNPDDIDIAPTNESNVMSSILIESSEETANLVEGDVADQNKMSAIKEIDDGIKPCSKKLLEDQLAANDKRTQEAESSFLLEDNEITSSLKVLKEAPIELSEMRETIEKGHGAVQKNTEVHKSAGPAQKYSDVDVKQSAFDARENLEQIGSSVVSLQSDTTASADAGGPSQKSETSLQIGNGAAESHSVKCDDFEPPSCMTLVEPGNRPPQEPTQVDLTASSTQQQKAEDQEAGWYPSILNVVNESQGRKNYKEVIAKVSNWSPGRENAPLKSLEGEVRSSNLKQPSSRTEKDETSSKSRGAAVTTVNIILRSEPNEKELEKERGSTPTYPVEIKKEKRKRRPNWVPFVCCSLVHRDL